jgi:hypothetical protein
LYHSRRRGLKQNIFRQQHVLYQRPLLVWMACDFRLLLWRVIWHINICLMYNVNIHHRLEQRRPLAEYLQHLSNTIAAICFHELAL